MNGKKEQRVRLITGFQGFLLLTLSSQPLTPPPAQTQSTAAVEFTQQGNSGWEVGAPSPLRRAGLGGMPCFVAAQTERLGCTDRIPIGQTAAWLSFAHISWVGPHRLLTETACVCVRCMGTERKGEGQTPAGRPQERRRQTCSGPAACRWSAGVSGADLRRRGGCEGQELHIVNHSEGSESICSEQAGRRRACGQQA